MTNQLGWFTARELAGLPGMPGTERAIQIRGKSDWQGRKRNGSKVIEYRLTDLPGETQAAILARSVAEASDNLPVVLGNEEVDQCDAKALLASTKSNVRSCWQGSPFAEKSSGWRKWFRSGWPSPPC